MISLILGEVQNNQSIEEATKKIDELEKQISSLQENIISTQNDKITSLFGDMGSILNLFSVALALIFGLSTFALVYITWANKKAQDNMENAKNLMAKAKESSDNAELINTNAANELKEVEKKVKEVDNLVKLSQKQSLAYAKINQCRSNIEIISMYSSTKIYTSTIPGLHPRMIKSTLENFSERKEQLSSQIEVSSMIVNTMVETFYSNIDTDRNTLYLDTTIKNIENEIKKIDKVYKELETLLTESREYYNDTLLKLTPIPSQENDTEEK